MNDNVYFRKAMRGFNRSDVISYIEKINRENMEKFNEMSQKLAETEKKLSDACEELERVKKELSEKESESSAENVILEEEKIKNEKAEKYDKISAQLADIILNAENSAAEITNKARAESEKYLMDANKRVAELNAMLLQKRNLIAASKLEMSRILSEINTCVDDLCHRSNTLYAAMESEKSEIVT